MDRIDEQVVSVKLTELRRLLDAAERAKLVYGKRFGHAAPLILDNDPRLRRSLADIELIATSLRELLGSERHR